MPRTKKAGESPNSENEGGAGLSGWCSNCNLFLFMLPNQWKRLSGEYVYHSQGAAATPTLLNGLESMPGELMSGAGQLDKCRVTYLYCKKCDMKKGLRCVQGTREKRFKNHVMLKMRKVDLRRSIGSERIEFDLGDKPSGEDEEDEEVEGKAAEHQGRQVDDADEAMDADAANYDEDDEEEEDDDDDDEIEEVGSKAFYRLRTTGKDDFTAPAPALAPTPSNAVQVQEQGNSKEGNLPNPLDLPNTNADPNSKPGPACLPCHKRHRKCNRSYPVCKTCEDLGGQCKWPPYWVPPVEEIAERPKEADSTDNATEMVNVGGTIVMGTQVSTPQRPESPENKSPAPLEVSTESADVSCNMCNMRHWSCDRTLPQCSNCTKQSNGKPCIYKDAAKRAAAGNAIDALDQSQHRAVSFNTNSSAPLYDQDDHDGDDEEDDDIQPILPRSIRPHRPPSAGSADSRYLAELQKSIADQKSIIELQGKMLSEHDNLVKNLTAQMLQLHENTQTKLATMSAKNRRMEKVLQELTKNGAIEVGKLTSALNSSEGWKAWKAPAVPEEVVPSSTRQSAPARRGGLAINGGRKSLRDSDVSKRTFGDRDSVGSNGQLVKPPPKEGNLPTFSPAKTGGNPQDETSTKGSSSRDSTEHNSLYDATPPPEDKAAPDANAMDVDVPSSAREDPVRGKTIVVGTAINKSGQSTPLTLARQPARFDTQELNDNETQEYLKRFVRDDDPEDEDFSPGEDSQPNSNTAGVNIGGNQPDSIPPAYRLPNSVTHKRRSTGKPRGRPPTKLRNSMLPVQDHASLENSQLSFVPSTPSAVTPSVAHPSAVTPSFAPPTFTSSRGGTKRRGISGATRPVPSEFSHGAFSSSQAATLINDPTPKRPKLIGPAPVGAPESGAATPESFSSAVSPPISVYGSGGAAAAAAGAKSASRRYPQGRMRDAEGFLLNADGTRDKRSVRGRLLGKNAFRNSNGERITVETLMRDKSYRTGVVDFNGGADAAFSSNTNNSDISTMATPLALTNSPYFGANGASATSRSGGFGGVRNNGVDTTPTAQRTSLQAQPRSSPADFGKVAAKAIEDRMATAMAKGNGLQYSDRHHELMTKMGL